MHGQYFDASAATEGMCALCKIITGADRGWRFPLGCRSGSHELRMALCTV